MAALEPDNLGDEAPVPCDDPDAVAVVAGLDGDLHQQERLAQHLPFALPRAASELGEGGVGLRREVESQGDGLHAPRVLDVTATRNSSTRGTPLAHGGRMPSPKTPRRPDDLPPFATWGETREQAIERVLAVGRKYSTHPETAAELGVALRTVHRWWDWLRAEGVPGIPERRRGGTPAQRAKAVATKRAKKRRIAGL